MISIVTDSVESTEAQGAELARFLSAGDFISLTGELGAGKTCFARGIARGLNISQSVPFTSPTYTLLNIYQGRIPLYHFDLYRLAGEEVDELGFEEYFYGDGVSLVEWAERLRGELPEERLDILLEYETEARRRITFTPHGKRIELIVQACIKERSIKKI